MDEYRREIEELKDKPKNKPITDRRTKIMVGFLIFLIITVVGSALFLPYKIAGIIALGGLGIMLAWGIFSPSTDRLAEIYHPSADLYWVFLEDDDD